MNPVGCGIIRLQSQHLGGLGRKTVRLSPAGAAYQDPVLPKANNNNKKINSFFLHQRQENNIANVVTVLKWLGEFKGVLYFSVTPQGKSSAMVMLIFCCSWGICLSYSHCWTIVSPKTLALYLPDSTLFRVESSLLLSALPCYKYSFFPLNSKRISSPALYRVSE
jgi:hypothetical protein